MEAGTDLQTARDLENLSHLISDGMTRATAILDQLREVKVWIDTSDKSKLHNLAREAAKAAADVTQAQSSLENLHSSVLAEKQALEHLHNTIVAAISELGGEAGLKALQREHEALGESLGSTRTRL